MKKSKYIFAFFLFIIFFLIFLINVNAQPNQSWVPPVIYEHNYSILYFTHGVVWFPDHPPVYSSPIDIIITKNNNYIYDTTIGWHQVNCNNIPNQPPDGCDTSQEGGVYCVGGGSAPITCCYIACLNFTPSHYYGGPGNYTANFSYIAYGSYIRGARNLTVKPTFDYVEWDRSSIVYGDRVKLIIKPNAPVNEVNVTICLGNRSKCCVVTGFNNIQVINGWANITLGPENYSRWFNSWCWKDYYGCTSENCSFYARAEYNHATTQSSNDLTILTLPEAFLRAKPGTIGWGDATQFIARVVINNTQNISNVLINITVNLKKENEYEANWTILPSNFSLYNETNYYKDYRLNWTFLSFPVNYYNRSPHNTWYTFKGKITFTDEIKNKEYGVYVLNGSCLSDLKIVPNKIYNGQNFNITFKVNDTWAGVRNCTPADCNVTVYKINTTKLFKIYSPLYDDNFTVIPSNELNEIKKFPILVNNPGYIDITITPQNYSDWISQERYCDSNNNCSFLFKVDCKDTLSWEWSKFTDRDFLEISKTSVVQAFWNNCWIEDNNKCYYNETSMGKIAIHVENCSLLSNKSVNVTIIKINQTNQSIINSSYLSINESDCWAN
ncbi:MAG: hypothetical protein QXQ30_02285, partial [Candidatus Pacearchaeota archaeon]